MRSRMADSSAVSQPGSTCSCHRRCKPASSCLASQGSSAPLLHVFLQLDQGGQAGLQARQALHWSARRPGRGCARRRPRARGLPVRPAGPGLPRAGPRLPRGRRPAVPGAPDPDYAARAIPAASAHGAVPAPASGGRRRAATAPPGPGSARRARQRARLVSAAGGFAHALLDVGQRRLGVLGGGARLFGAGSAGGQVILGLGDLFGAVLALGVPLGDLLLQLLAARLQRLRESTTWRISASRRLTWALAS